MEPGGPLAESIICALRGAKEIDDLKRLMEAVAGEIGFRFWALIHHDEQRGQRPGLVDLKNYPAGVVDKFLDQHHFRRDPIVRGCLFADSAFVWSALPRIITIDGKDRAALAFGADVGLNEGITVPSSLLGDCIGSCTFAGMRRPQDAERLLGFVQMVGIFAFQAARRLFGPQLVRRPTTRLHPRPRECIVLAGRGLSNKEIARVLALAPRTVDGYLTEARRLFELHDRTELVVSAVLAGEVGLHELKPRQPE